MRAAKHVGPLAVGTLVAAGLVTGWGISSWWTHSRLLEELCGGEGVYPHCPLKQQARSELRVGAQTALLVGPALAVLAGACMYVLHRRRRASRGEQARRHRHQQTRLRAMIHSCRRSCDTADRHVYALRHCAREAAEQSQRGGPLQEAAGEVRVALQGLRRQSRSAGRNLRHLAAELRNLLLLARDLPAMSRASARLAQRAHLLALNLNVEAQRQSPDGESLKIFANEADRIGRKCSDLAAEGEGRFAQLNEGLIRTASEAGSARQAVRERGRSLVTARRSLEAIAAGTAELLHAWQRHGEHLENLAGEAVSLSAGTDAALTGSEALLETQAPTEAWEELPASARFRRRSGSFEPPPAMRERTPQAQGPPGS